MAVGLILVCPRCAQRLRLAVDLSLYEPYAICDNCHTAWDGTGWIADPRMVQGL